MNSLKGKDLLTLAELSAEEIYSLLAKALEFKRLKSLGRGRRLLEGKTVALIFEKPSTRTRVSFEVALFELGAHPLFLKSDDLQLKRGESLEDLGKVLSSYVSAIVIRTFAQRKVEDLAKAATVPVINGLSDDFHPCQILADFLTVLEKKKRLKGLKLAYLGDGNNVANTLVLGASKVGLNIFLASPPGHQVKETLVKEVLKEKESSAQVILTNDPEEAARNADLIYTDVWVSMGKKEEAKIRTQFRPYQVNKKNLSLAKSDCLVMHCLPAHRGQEITEEVMEDPRFIGFDQAENRLHLQKALLVALIG